MLLTSTCSVGIYPDQTFLVRGVRRFAGLARHPIGRSKYRRKKRVLRRVSSEIFGIVT